MHKILLLLLALSITGCTVGSLSTTEIDDMHADCSNVDQKIGMLEQQKVKHGNRLGAGLESIMPTVALAHVIEGDYENNAKIASGKWHDSVNAKLIELRSLQSLCVSTPAATHDFVRRNRL